MAYRFPSDPVEAFPPEVPHYQQEALPLINCTSRAGGYNPTRVYISGQIKEQFDPHPQVDPVIALFYSNENIRRLQDETARAGLGRPRPQSFKPYMDLAMQNERGVGNASCIPNYKETIHEHIEGLNARTLQMVRSNMQNTKFGYEQFYRDISMRRIPEYQKMRPLGYTEDTLIHPYYNSLQ